MGRGQEKDGGGWQNKELGPHAGSAKTHTEIGITDAITTLCLSMYDTIHFLISCIHVLDRSFALMALSQSSQKLQME